jgi:hypothetical protein
MATEAISHLERAISQGPRIGFISGYLNVTGEFIPVAERLNRDGI